VQIVSDHDPMLLKHNQQQQESPVNMSGVSDRGRRGRAGCRGRAHADPDTTQQVCTGFDLGLTPGHTLTVAGSPAPPTADARPISLWFQKHLPTSGMAGVP
jgi:hypothetical protein